MSKTNKLKISLVPDTATGRYSVSDHLLADDSLLKEVELLPSELAELMKKLIPDDLDQHSLPPPTIELVVEDVLPRAKVQLSISYGDDNLAPHDLPLQMRVGVVLAGVVVAPLPHRRRSTTKTLCPAVAAS